MHAVEYLLLRQLKIIKGSKNPVKSSITSETIKAYKLALQRESSKTNDKFSRMLDIASKQLQFRLKEFLIEDKTLFPQTEEEEETAIIFDEDSDEGDDTQINDLKDRLKKEKQDLYNLMDEVVNEYQGVLTNERNWLIRQIQDENSETKNRGFEECCCLTAEGHLVGMKAGDYVQKLVKDAEDGHMQLLQQRNDSVKEVGVLLDRLGLFQ